ncbi:putative type II restriction enzyme [Helicobacter pylori]|uniref:Putative type II restriction enzyme n=1 Tax=Helicobacter pylori TaxID=210 RepID=A0A238GUX8_HELPX|nr:putative type II restriction enzyme [Helicobacter pylori]
MDNKDPKDIAILCGTNIKTIFNTYGTSTKEVVLDIAEFRKRQHDRFRYQY